MKATKFLFFLIILIVLFSLSCNAPAQAILNGSFEDNLLSSNEINLSNHKYDSVMNYSRSYSANANIDVIRTPDFCNSLAEDGQWYIAMTGADSMSLQLSQPLVKGSSYQVTFYDKFCEVFPNVMTSEVLIGLSTNKDSFGTLLGTTRAPLTNDWMQNAFSFIAPCDGTYITIKLKTGTAHDTWVEFDDFTLSKSVSVNEYPLDSAIVIFPNPAKNMINIQSTDPIKEVKIYSLSGTLLFDNTPQTSANTVHTDISTLTTGLYFIQIMQGNMITTRKFIKSNY